MIQQFADWLVYDIFDLAQGTKLTDGVNFFIYDSIKIGLLLIVINYLMAITRYYFPIEKARNILTKKRWLGFNYLLAAILGVVTPFCSCSSIPLFIGFLGAGIPLGITFAFLISSPLINEASLYLFPIIFGMKITILYNLFGLLIAIIGGLLIQKLKVEKYVIPEFLNFKSRAQIKLTNNNQDFSFSQLFFYFWKDSFQITKRIFPYIILGVGIGAVIHGFVPNNLAEKYLSAGSWWTVPIAVFLGAPLYANSIGVLPIMEVMAQKGIPAGTVLAFMTSIVALSLPEALILKKVMRWQLLAIFFGITITGIILMGYFFNLIT